MIALFFGFSTDISWKNDKRMYVVLITYFSILQKRSRYTLGKIIQQAKVKMNIGPGTDCNDVRFFKLVIRTSRLSDLEGQVALSISCKTTVSNKRYRIISFV